MLLLPRYNFDIPIHPPEAKVATRYEFEIAAAQAIINNPYDPTFLRAAAIRIPTLRLEGLKKVLKRTDEQLEILAEKCGATVIKHEWGLFPVEDDPVGKFDYYQLPLHVRLRLGIPKQHILVADVEALDNPVCPDSRSGPNDILHQIRKGTDEYKQSSRGIVLADLREDQIGVVNGNQAKYIDVEPILERSTFLTRM